MNDWHRHHGTGKAFKARQRFAGAPGSEGMPAGADESGFGAGGPGFRGRGRPGGHGGPRHSVPGFPGGAPGFGPWPRGYGRRGGRAKRGDVRAAVLALLAEEPMNGYQIIQQIAERSGGLWRPSPGSVYPALAQLEDEELICQQGTEGSRRAYALTEAGRTYAAQHPEELTAPWSAMTGDAANAAADMHLLVRQIHLAAFQVMSAGTDAQIDQARKVLAQTRRALYRILAEDDAGEDQPAGGPDGTAAGHEPQ